MGRLESVDSGYGRELKAVILGGIVLIAVNVILLVRLLGESDNPLQSVPGWVFAFASTVIVSLLAGWAIRIARRRDRRRRDADAMLRALEHVTPALERRAFRDLLQSLARRVSDVMDAQ